MTKAVTVLPAAPAVPDPRDLRGMDPRVVKILADAQLQRDLLALAQHPTYATILGTVATEAFYKLDVLDPTSRGLLLAAILSSTFITALGEATQTGFNIASLIKGFKGA